MKVNSLSFRLLASTALLVAIILPLTAFVLTSYYRHAVEQTIDQRLKVSLDNLVSLSLRLARESENSTGQKRIELADPLFKRPFSGWYWQIILPGGDENSAIISDSLLDERLSLINEKGAGSDLPRQYVKGPENQLLRLMQKTIFTGGEPDEGQAEGAGRGVSGKGNEGSAKPPLKKSERYVYSVAIDARELDQEVARFRNLLLLALGVLGLGLLLAGLMQVRYGLAPLHVISRKLNDIRAGQEDHLSGQFPAEIEPLQRELNALIRSNRDVVERARTHVGNLAHALKTPLSVISNEIDKINEGDGRQKKKEMKKYADNIGKQTQLMKDQVRHHLDRARMAAKSGVIGNSTPVEPVLNSLARTLQKIYRQRDIELDVESVGNLSFRGEKQDLEEMLGNLLDNAFKYTHSLVRLEAIKAPDRPGFLLLSVDDNGPGLSASKRKKAMQRGQRLDENVPGSGLGLSIVADLAHLYDGNFCLEASKMGGLRAELLLPMSLS